MKYFDFIYEGDYDETAIDKAVLAKLITKHKQYLRPELIKCQAYYNGDQEIVRRTKKDDSAPNNKVVCNHAQDISNTAVGYFLANAINYSTKEENDEALDKLTDAFDVAATDDVDHDNGLDLSIGGCAYEFVYAKEDEATPLSKNLSNISTFMVYDDTIEQNELFAVYYWEYKPVNIEVMRYKAFVMTQHYIYELDLDHEYKEKTIVTEEPRPHNFGEVPVIFYKNNKYCLGDFELQISLIDAYNTLMSDRLNDKEQFLDSIMVLYGAIMGDDDEETSEAMKTLKEERLLELPEGSKAEYITRTFDENGVEVLRKAIKHDIYTFSHVPDLSDENFAGNTSGVAMEYKLMGLEMITKTKSRYYQQGLKKRIRLYCNFLNLKNYALNPTAIIVTFKRALPKNMLELSQIVANLDGRVSQKTLISQLPFVEDPDGEIKALKEEKEENMERQQEMFGRTANNRSDEDEVDEESYEGAKILA